MSRRAVAREPLQICFRYINAVYMKLLRNIVTRLDQPNYIEEIRSQLKNAYRNHNAFIADIQLIKKLIMIQ